MTLKITFRSLALGAVAVGLALGATFGVGVAYGRGTPKTVSAGLTQQQLSSLLGTDVAAAAGAGGAAGQAASGAAGQQRQAGGAAGTQALTRTATGKITAIEGRTITVETRQGNQTINLGANATIEKVSAGALSDLKVGDTIIASGSRNNDGSFDATSLSQVPQELQSLINIGGGGQQQAPGGR